MSKDFKEVREFAMQISRGKPSEAKGIASDKSITVEACRLWFRNGKAGVKGARRREGASGR